ncbi:RNA polymerase II-binding domain-containing protein [Coniochaeta sp. 2T2.1]|nr:RNA polymerase II-binding domain-containing protein [Coniochaeta sp. 2T2.1]
MAYTDDAVLAKLSALNESHDSIATAAQWIMFHRRHADRTVQLWLQRLKDSPSPKRLNLIYLANEVAQQTKARHKEDFVLAFSPVLAEATAAAYKGATSDIQNKLRRVVQVWRERQIFEPPIQDAVEARLQELDNARGAAKASGPFGGSIFGSSLAPSSLPSELRELLAPQQNVSKQVLPVKSSLSTANAEYEKLFSAAAKDALPAPPVYAAKLSGLLKHLATAENAVAESVKARTELVAALEKILSTNRAALDSDVSQQKVLAGRRQEVESRRQEVENEIIRGMGAASEGGANDNHHHHLSPEEGGSGGGQSASPQEQQEPERPEMEALTPPPGGDGDGDDLDFYNNDIVTPQKPEQQPGPFPLAAPGIEMLSNLASQYQSVPVALNGSHKRRRVDSGEEFPDLGGDDGIDADVAEMIRKESQGS